MELGVHDDYEVYFYSLLPNAPAAEPAFMKRWQIETVDRYLFTGSKGSWVPGELDVRSNRSRVIVQTSSFSREDWLKMWAFTSLVKALHNSSVTRLIALYLRFTHAVSYATFYEDLIEGFFATHPLTRPWYEQIVQCYRNFRDDPNGRDRILVKELPNFPQA